MLSYKFWPKNELRLESFAYIMPAHSEVFTYLNLQIKQYVNEYTLLKRFLSGLFCKRARLNEEISTVAKFFFLYKVFYLIPIVFLFTFYPNRLSLPTATLYHNVKASLWIITRRSPCIWPLALTLDSFPVSYKIENCSEEKNSIKSRGI